MKYKIEQQGDTPLLKVNHVSIFPVTEGVLYIAVDTDVKWPKIYGAGEDDREGILLSRYDVNDDLKESAEVIFIPEDDWEKRVILAKQSSRYGWVGFIVSKELVSKAVDGEGDYNE